MNPSEIGVPPSVEGAPPSAGPGPDDQSRPDVSQAHYRTSDEECFQCEHFDGNNTCNLGVNGGQTEPGAGCDLFEMKTGSDNDGDEQQGDAPPMPGGGQGAPPASMVPQGSPQQ